MGEFPASVRAVRFGVFEVDLRAGELTKRGTRIRLQGQPFLLLVTLLKQRGEVVTREDLRRTLWPEDTFVDFDHSLGSAANKLREALGDSATNPRFIETLPRRGYRFIAPFEAVVENQNTPVLREPTPDQEQPASANLPMVGDPDPTDRVVEILVRPPRPSPWKIFAGAVILLSAGFIGFILIRSRPTALIRSLAVLPLENLRRSITRIPLRRYDRRIDHRVGADRRTASNLPDLGDDIQTRAQAFAPDCAGIKRRRRRGRDRLAFGKLGSHHRAADPGF